MAIQANPSRRRGSPATNPIIWPSLIALNRTTSGKVRTANKSRTGQASFLKHSFSSLRSAPRSRREAGRMSIKRDLSWLRGLNCITFCALFSCFFAKEVIEQTCKFHREDIFRGWTCTDGLERLEILKGHGLLIYCLCGIEDRFKCQCKTLCTQKLRLPFTFRRQNYRLLLTFGSQDVRLFLTFSHINGSFACTGRLGHDRAADAFGRHLTVHRILNFAWRDNFADFHVGHFHTPTFGYFIETSAEHVVDVLAFRKNVIERDTAYHRPQSGGGNTGS